MAFPDQAVLVDFFKFANEQIEEFARILPYLIKEADLDFSRETFLA